MTTEQKSTLVFGGAGYIGSHVLLSLAENNEQNVTVVDNLSAGTKEALQHGEYLEVMDIADEAKLFALFEKYRPETILHFAAFLDVGESVRDPLKYYANNTKNTLQILRACVQYGVKNIIFSSTAAVYGDVSVPLVDEKTPTHPINPYGWSKLMSEQMIQDTAKASGLNYVILRYFNVAGADPEGRIGSRNKNAHHLMKVCLDVAQGKREFITMFGADYPTLDGTGVRDYIHVSDLAKAHTDSLTYLRNGGESGIFNVGYGKGYSVKEVIAAVETVVGKKLDVRDVGRRPGDSPKVVADSSKIRAAMHWTPEHDNLEEMVRDAWNWQQQIERS